MGWRRRPSSIFSPESESRRAMAAETKRNQNMDPRNAFDTPTLVFLRPSAGESITTLRGRRSEMRASRVDLTPPKIVRGRPRSSSARRHRLVVELGTS